MCHFETTFKADSPYKEVHQLIKKRLEGMISDGLVKLDGDKVTVTREGIPFVRNCCMIFDQDLEPNTKLERMFSQTI